MKNVLLVTGGAGFIGSHLAQGLIEKSYEVRVLDNLSTGHHAWVPKQAEFIKGDIRDLTTCQQAMKDVIGVFHCAAMSRVAPSSDNVDLCTQINIVGTQNILIAARDHAVKKIVYSGSSTYYGNQASPQTEYVTPAELLNFYALSKQVGESYCQLFYKQSQLPYVILRYFNVYGPRQSEEGAYALVLGVFLKRWAQGLSLEIHGDGSQRRDFIHVNDVVKANIAAFESPLENEILNIGSGTNISITELANAISSNQVHLPRRPGDAEITLADISRAKQLLAWEPKISFQEGLDALIRKSAIS